MNDRQAAFVEEMGQYLSSVGMTPMAGRMLAWLLICDPVEQTAAELADSLRASRGAISGAARSLETAGFVRRTRRRGDRREYFSMPPGAISALITGAGQIYHRLEVIAAHGIGVVADLPPPKRERIEEFHDFVAYVERVVPALLEQYVRDRDQARASMVEETILQASA
ncbi:MAG: helix-turn-helix domain-containing protein [Chloroflexota bacterium]